MPQRIPQPKGVPLLGNIFDITPSNTWVSLQKLWEKHGSIFKITVLGQQIVFVGSVALCAELCDESRFRKFVGGPIVEIRRAVHDSLFTAFADEPSWPVHHRILAPLLTPDVIKSRFAELRDCVGELTRKWSSAATTAGGTVMPIDDLNRLDLETTTLCFYGRKIGGITSERPDPMIAAMDGATGEAIMRPTRPRIVNWLLHQGKFDRDCEAMRTYARKCLQYRREHPEVAEQRRGDMLDVMINGKDPVTGQGLKDSQIIDEVVTMPIGSSTAPCVIASALYYLTQNPRCVKTAREEIDAVLGDGEFTHELLDKLPYCAGIVRESMRLSAAAPGFNIEPRPDVNKSPVLIGGGKYEVPAKQTMIVVLHGVNRDPDVFDSPEEFRPERMVGESFEKLPEGAKKWFGNGKRVCVGKEWAWMWCLTVMVNLLREVDVEAADKGYQLKQDGWFNLRPVGFKVKVKGRER